MIRLILHKLYGRDQMAEASAFGYSNKISLTINYTILFDQSSDQAELSSFYNKNDYRNFYHLEDIKV